MLPVHAAVASSTLVVCGGLPVAKFLQETCTLILPVPAGAGGVHVVLQSDSALLNLSTSPTAAGSASIALDIAAGANQATYYLQSLGDTGSANYHASAPGYADGLGSVDLVPSGIVILGSGVVNLSSGGQTMQIFTARLDATNAPINPQALAGGAALTVTLHSSDPTVGSLPGTVQIAPGTPSSNVTFTPHAVGTTTLSVDQPAGWTLPTALTTLGVVVQ